MSKITDWLLPLDTFTDLCRVEFVKTTPALSFTPTLAAFTAAGGLCAPLSPLLETTALDYDPMPGWKRWVVPFYDLLSIVRVARGEVMYP